mgnify:CR=1 FL=1
MKPAARESTSNPQPTTHHRSKILVVDDEPSMRELLDIVLRREGHEVFTASNGKAAIEILEREPIDLLVSDIKMPDMSGVEVLKAAKLLDPDIVGIMVTAYASVENAVEAMHLGAYDYVSKPFNVDELKLRIRKALERKQLAAENDLLRRALQTTHRFSNIIGKSDAMQSLFQLIETIAPTTSTVLLSGESGTGKELVARAVHFNSPRRDRPFVAVNCGALPETLLESELFGHVKGSFTGAVSDAKGVFQTAHTGTVFLDEVGEMSPALQVKLLRVLQEGEVRPVGASRAVKTDVRIVAATNVDVERAVAEGKFRQDLFYRLGVVIITLPPLRERREDIPLLIERFLKAASAKALKQVDLTPAAVDALTSHHWPGNVRELENVVQRAVVLCRTETIDFPLLAEDARLQTAVPRARPATGSARYKDLVDEFEKDVILDAMRRADGVQKKAAELLGLKPTTLNEKLKRLRIRP